MPSYADLLFLAFVGEGKERTTKNTKECFILVKPVKSVEKKQRKHFKKRDASGSHLRSPGLKTGYFNKKSVVLVERENGLAKTFFFFFFFISKVFCPRDGFSKSIFEPH